MGLLTAEQALYWIAKHSAQLVERRTGWPRETWYQVILPSGTRSQGKTPADAVNSMAAYLRSMDAVESIRKCWYMALVERATRR